MPDTPSGKSTLLMPGSGTHHVRTFDDPTVSPFSSSTTRTCLTLAVHSLTHYAHNVNVRTAEDQASPRKEDSPALRGPHLQQAVPSGPTLNDRANELDSFVDVDGRRATGGPHCHLSVCAVACASLMRIIYIYIPRHISKRTQLRASNRDLSVAFLRRCDGRHAHLRLELVGTPMRGT